MKKPLLARWLGQLIDTLVGRFGPSRLTEWLGYRHTRLLVKQTIRLAGKAKTADDLKSICYAEATDTYLFTAVEFSLLKRYEQRLFDHMKAKGWTVNILKTSWIISVLNLSAPNADFDGPAIGDVLPSRSPLTDVDTKGRLRPIRSVGECESRLLIREPLPVPAAAQKEPRVLQCMTPGMKGVLLQYHGPANRAKPFYPLNYS